MKLHKITENLYEAEDGTKIAREFDTITPNGNKLTGEWVLRDPLGRYVDFNNFRYDLAQAHNLELVSTF